MRPQGTDVLNEAMLEELGTDDPPSNWSWYTILSETQDRGDSLTYEPFYRYHQTEFQAPNDIWALAYTLKHGLSHHEERWVLYGYNSTFYELARKEMQDAV